IQVACPVPAQVCQRPSNIGARDPRVSELRITLAYPALNWGLSPRLEEVRDGASSQCGYISGKRLSRKLSSHPLRCRLRGFDGSFSGVHLYTVVPEANNL